MPANHDATSLRASPLLALLAIAACGDDGGTAADTTSDTSSGSTGVASSESSTVSGSTGVDTTSSSSTSSSEGSSSSESSSTGDTGGGLDDDAIMRIHEAVAQTLGTGFSTGCAVAIWREGEVIYAEGFGTKDEPGNPVTNDTLFQIGSDTKKMAAIAVLQQVEAGNLALDQPVNEVIEGLELAQSPAHLDTVTLHALLSHQTGLWDYTPWTDNPADAWLGMVTMGSFAANEYAMMPPSIAWNYANPNFSLAGLVTEQATGRAWADVVIEDVAVPLGMTQTWARRDDVLANADDVASGFGILYPGGLDTFDLLDLLELVPSPPAWVTPEQQADNAFTRPAGMVWSTASDMARLGGFLIDGDTEVLSQASLDTLLTAHVPLLPGVDPDEMGYGYGVMRRRGFFGPENRFYDVPMLVHGGNTLSMTSTTALLPEQSVALSILCNGAYDDASLIEAVALEEAAIDALPAPSQPYSPLMPPRDDLSGYAGTFHERVLGDVTLELVDGELLVDIPALTALGYEVSPLMMPVARDVFLMDIEGATLDVSFYDGEQVFEFGVNRSFVLARGDGAMPGVAPDPQRVHAWVRNTTRLSPQWHPRW